MNKRVLQTSIILVVGMLAFQYILKIFFPQELVMVITNPRIIQFGNWVDKNSIALELFAFTTSLITYYLFLCAACKKWKLNKRETLITVSVVAAIQIIVYFEPDFIMILSIMGMLGLACYLKANFKTTIIVFSIHTISQALSIKIRGLMFLLPDVNYATIFCLGLECWLWLLLLYFTNNYKKEKLNG